MGATFSQYFPPSPTFTEKDLPDLHGRVFVVTGGYGGIGYEIASRLYGAGGRVYIIGRSAASGARAVEALRQLPGVAGGASIEFIQADMSDLESVQNAAKSLLAQVSTIEILFNNAGVGGGPLLPRSAQGYDPTLATNVLGPFLLTKLLLPALEANSGQSRVIWTGSILIDVMFPKGVGIDLEHHIKQTVQDVNFQYPLTKLCNWFLAAELARRTNDESILSFVVNPGNLRTDAYRHLTGLLKFTSWAVSYESRFGAYTNLWAAFSKQLDKSNNGSYILPWGRLHSNPRSDLVEAGKPKEEGGKGQAAELWSWCEEKVKPYST